jgi:hypothetical protein
MEPGSGPKVDSAGLVQWAGTTWAGLAQQMGWSDLGHPVVVAVTGPYRIWVGLVHKLGRIRELGPEGAWGRVKEASCRRRAGGALHRRHGPKKCMRIEEDNARGSSVVEDLVVPRRRRRLRWAEADRRSGSKLVEACQ